jgi:hypothetical protein
VFQRKISPPTSGFMFRLCGYQCFERNVGSHIYDHKQHPGSTVLLQTIIVAKTVKKFSAFYGSWRFITMFTTAYPALSQIN